MVGDGGSTPSTVTRLALSAVAGDPDAFDRLYVRCREVLLVRASRWWPDVDAGEREDVVADALLVAFTQLRSGDFVVGQGSFLGWLDRVVRHDFVDAERRRRRRPRVVDPVQLDAGTTRPDAGPATRAVAAESDRELVRRVQQALAAVPERYADVLVLRFVLGLGVDDVAHELGLQRRQVIDATYEARRRLFARLPRGEVDWVTFLAVVERLAAITTPAAARELRVRPLELP